MGDTRSPNPGAGDANEPDDVLENSEGLGWASMGLWTDVAVRSNPKVIESTISALNQGLQEQNNTRRRSRLELRVQLALAITGATLSAGISVGLLTISLPATSKTILTTALSIVVSATALSLGGLYATIYVKKRVGKERKLFRTVLDHELDYRRRLAERDS